VTLYSIRPVFVLMVYSPLAAELFESRISLHDENMYSGPSQQQLHFYSFIHLFSE